MKILAIETSTAHGSVAFLENNKVKFERVSKEQKSHSEVVHSFIEQGLGELKWKISQIDLFATTIGPGSFTGIRVSVNSTKSFSFVFNKPTIGVDSLTCLASLNLKLILNSLPISSDIELITCMINAYKNMVYIAQYSIKGSQLISVRAPSVVRVQDMGTVIAAPTLVVGDGFLVYENHFSAEVKSFCKRYPNFVDYPSAHTTGQLALELWTNKTPDSTFEWNLISPLYLRASEAEENKKGIKYTPL